CARCGDDDSGYHYSFDYW
nr:immunoglobulin heavy chain junction region [Macaca mulatta]